MPNDASIITPQHQNGQSARKHLDVPTQLQVESSATAAEVVGVRNGVQNVHLWL